jgi:hypothetical protein
MTLLFISFPMNIDELIYNTTFTTDTAQQDTYRKQIHNLAAERGIYPASINNLYFAIGKGEVTGFTVPAINIRMMTYDTARTIFRLMIEHNIGAIIFEIARSEMQYTHQKPSEYTTSVLAAAIKEQYKGPIFLQGDHFQFSPAKFKEDPNAETQRLKDLIQESIAAKFYNIDIDASTLVDLTKEDIDEQQYTNYTKTAELTRYIRSIEPKDVTISIGGEIGHIGGVNSTVADFEAFMDGYIKEQSADNLTGISKVSVQTGTSHGGIPLADGSIARVNLDFNVLKTIGHVARKKYHIGGPVQHGASTLPIDLFDQFPKCNTLEIHLATGFQNTIYDTMPSGVKNKIYDWVRDNTKNEWSKDKTEDQNIYSTRKKAIGPFKKELWSLTEEQKQPIRTALEKQFTTLFNELNIKDTKKIVEQYAIHSTSDTYVTSTHKSHDEKVDDLSD